MYQCKFHYINHKFNPKSNWLSSEQALPNSTVLSLIIIFARIFPIHLQIHHLKIPCSRLWSKLDLSRAWSCQRTWPELGSLALQGINVCPWVVGKKCYLISILSFACTVLEECKFLLSFIFHVFWASNSCKYFLKTNSDEAKSGWAGSSYDLVEYFNLLSKTEVGFKDFLVLVHVEQYHLFQTKHN